MRLNGIDCEHLRIASDNVQTNSCRFLDTRELPTSHYGANAALAAGTVRMMLSHGRRARGSQPA